MTEIELDATRPSSTGLEPWFAAMLAYLAGPFSGMLILFAERTNRFVRFHAWQSIAGLGGLLLVAVALVVSAFLGLFFSPTAFRTLYVLAAVAAGVWLVAWGLCLFKAFGGSAWKLPLIGRFAERRVLTPP
jgi:uncharacterized membrane protein